MHRSLQPFSIHELKNRIMIIIENVIMVLLTYKNVLGFLGRSEGSRAQLNLSKSLPLERDRGRFPLGILHALQNRKVGR